MNAFEFAAVAAPKENQANAKFQQEASLLLRQENAPGVETKIARTAGVVAEGTWEYAKANPGKIALRVGEGLLIGVAAATAPAWALEAGVIIGGGMLVKQAYDVITKSKPSLKIVWDQELHSKSEVQNAKQQVKSTVSPFIVDNVAMLGGGAVGAKTGRAVLAAASEARTAMLASQTPARTTLPEAPAPKPVTSLPPEAPTPAPKVDAAKSSQPPKSDTGGSGLEQLGPGPSGKPVKVTDLKNGERLTILEDGTEVLEGHNSRFVKEPDGRRIEETPGLKKIFEPDGTVFKEYPNEHIIMERPNGEVLELKSDGTYILERPGFAKRTVQSDGTWILEPKKGGKTIIHNDGSRFVESPDGKVTRKPDIVKTHNNRLPAEKNSH
jgi:hypothetical protein